MSAVNIRTDLRTKLNTFATARSLTIAWQGEEYTKPVSGIWLEPYIIPSRTFNSPINGYRSTHIGLFQVNVNFQRGRGLFAAETIADAIVAAFPLVPKSGVVSVEATPTVERPIENPSYPGWWSIPVLIPYRYESSHVYFDGSTYTDAWTSFTSTVNDRLDAVEADVDNTMAVVEAFNDEFTPWQSYTPAVSFGGVATDGVFVSSSDYSAISGTVFLKVKITFSSKGTTAGDMSVSLPAAAGHSCAVSVGYVSDFVDTGFAGTSPFSAYVDGSSNSIKLVRQSEGGPIGVTIDDLTDTSEILLECFYKKQ